MAIDNTSSIVDINKMTKAQLLEVISGVNAEYNALKDTVSKMVAAHNTETQQLSQQLKATQNDLADREQHIEQLEAKLNVIEATKPQVAHKTELLKRLKSDKGSTPMWQNVEVVRGTGGQSDRFDLSFPSKYYTENKEACIAWLQHLVVVINERGMALRADANHKRGGVVIRIRPLDWVAPLDENSAI